MRRAISAAVLAVVLVPGVSGTAKADDFQAGIRMGDRPTSSGATLRSDIQVSAGSPSPPLPTPTPTPTPTSVPIQPTCDLLVSNEGGDFVDSLNVTVGDMSVVSGFDFPPSEEITVETVIPAGDTFVGTGASDSQGNFDGGTWLWEASQVGTWSMTAYPTADDTCIGSVMVVVAAAAVAPTPTPTPTGSADPTSTATMPDTATVPTAPATPGSGSLFAVLLALVGIIGASMVATRWVRRR